jgi:uncharacterized Zn finger protein
MDLSPEQKSTIEQWLKEKCPNLACPACGGSERETGDLMCLARGYAGGASSVSGGTLVVPVRCKNCGFVWLFSSQQMGIEPPGS